MSSYEQVHPNLQPAEYNQALPIVTGKEIGMWLNRTAESGYTSWQFLGGGSDEAGRAPATTTWFGVGALEASPLATSWDPEVGVQQDLHAVVYVPGVRDSKPAYLGVVGVNAFGQEGLLLVTLPSKEDPALVIDRFAHLDPAVEPQPTRRVGNTIVSYMPEKGVVTVTSYDLEKPSLVATAEQPMPRDTSILGDSWTLPSRHLCNVFNPEWRAEQDAANRTQAWVHARNDQVRAEARSMPPQVTSGVVIEGSLVDSSESLGHIQVVDATVVERSKPVPAPEQPTLQDVYAAYLQQSSPNQLQYSQHDTYSNGANGAYPYGNYSTAQTPDYAGAGQQVPRFEHPYYSDEDHDYGG